MPASACAASAASPAARASAAKYAADQSRGVTRRLETTIVVVGAGPVGMALAIDAAQRAATTWWSSSRGRPVSRRARSATRWRRAPWRPSAGFGIADEVRAAGLPGRLPDRRDLLTTIWPAPRSSASRSRRAWNAASPGFPTATGSRPSRSCASARSTWSRSSLARMRSLPNVTAAQRDTSVERVRAGPRPASRPTPADDESARSCSCESVPRRLRRRAQHHPQGRWASRCRATPRSAGRARAWSAAPGSCRLFGERRPAWMSWVVNERSGAT